jgi:hypothetical protein
VRSRPVLKSCILPVDKDDACRGSWWVLDTMAADDIATTEMPTLEMEAGRAIDLRPR